MKIAALVSGGVDSSVALYLLKEQGYEPAAFYLKVWMEDDFAFGDCPWQEDVNFVRKVAAQLGIRCEIVSMQREYWDKVVQYTIQEVKKGLTPNPDMMCNKLVKFGAFYDKCGHEFDFIATGHYAKIARDENGRAHLELCRDMKKDQTYFLSQLSYDQLARILFPIDSYSKSQIRQIARDIRLPNASRKDSQGICFLGKINFREFLQKYVGEKKGKIVEKSTGKILGAHSGFWFYTIGQRNGLGLGQGPWYVLDKDSDENTVYVSHASDSVLLEVDEIKLAHFNWINRPAGTNGSVPIQFKIRHSPELNDGCMEIAGDSVFIHSRSPLKGVAKGQFGVIYIDGECLGGGVISQM